MPKLLLAALLGAGAAALFMAAGPLNPPAGAVTSTYKTLTEVEPRTAINGANTPGDADSLFKITQPGSYYLTGNITGVVGKHGVEITASGVTLDLMGFDLAGVPAMGAFDGVSVTVNGVLNIAVVNGSVRNWGSRGIDLFGANNSRVAAVLASGNASTGIGIGTGGTVTNCAASNTIFGITTGDGCTITNCTAYSNSGSGISTGGGCTVTHCSAYSNSGSGFSVGSGCTITDCTARFNTLNGIVCSSVCVVRGNTCAGNGRNGDGAGIHAIAGDNRVEGNNCTGADRGIDVDAAGNVITRNTCSGNFINWEIAVGNSVGPIVVAGTNAAVISGNGPVASTLGSTDPNANFSY